MMILRILIMMVYFLQFYETQIFDEEKEYDKIFRNFVMCKRFLIFHEFQAAISKSFLENQWIMKLRHRYELNEFDK